MDTVEALKKAKALLKKGWCREAFARDKDGNPCVFHGGHPPDAVSFCIRGALMYVEAGETDANEVLMDILKKQNYCWPTEFNDDPKTTHKMVLDLFTKAIKKAKAK